MNKQNYQKLMDEELSKGSVDSKTLLLHACCAPCSSHCLTYLEGKIKIKVYYYNPNIVEDGEYVKRAEELNRLIKILNEKYPDAKIEFIEGEHEPERFLDMAKGLEMVPEGGERCKRCFELRLRESARKALEEGADYFTTTLTISPLKNAPLINEIGQKIGEELGIKWLFSDFKKKEGYKHSVELSAEYGLYRQDYCGCPFSKAERERQALKSSNQ